MGLLVKILLGVFVISAIGLWLGFDATRVSYYSGDLVAFDVEEIEKNGIGDKRYVQINKAVWDGSMVYEAKPLPSGSVGPSSEVKTVILPLMSSKEFGSLTENANSRIEVLVKYDMPRGTTLSDLEGGSPIGQLVLDKSKAKLPEKKPWMPEQTKDVGEEFSVSGVTLVGLDSLDTKSRDLLTSLNHQISPDVVFLKAGDKPSSLTFGLTVMGISLLGFFGSPLAAYKFYYWTKNGRSSDVDPTPLNLND